MPDKAYDEVRFMLEAHQNDPSRVQVCTWNWNHFTNIKILILGLGDLKL